MLFALALVSTSAHAGGFNDAMLPHTTHFSYTWDVAGAQGSTSFSFLNGTHTTGNTYQGVCNDLGACLEGDFETGNNGDGTYETEIRLRSAVTCFFAIGIASCFGDGTVSCDIEQGVELTYAGTGATYTGEAFCGTADIEYTSNGCFDWNFVDRSYSLVNSSIIGTMSHSSGASGTFTEI